MSDAEKILKVIADWGQEAIATFNADGAYAFGSLVYLEGEQLTTSSDIDLANQLSEFGGTILRQIIISPGYRYARVNLSPESKSGHHI